MEILRDLSLSGYAFAAVYDVVPSTMDVARTRIAELYTARGDSGSVAGLVVARTQTAGRGRQGRSWVSESGAFMGTFLFRAAGPVAGLSGYPLVVGVALVRAAQEVGARVSLKWPNDIVVIGRASEGAAVKKLGGILVEVHESSPDERVVLVGIGINLSQAPSSVSHAESLRRVNNREVSVDEVAALLSRHLLQVHQEFLRGGGFQAFQSEWEAASVFTVGVTELTIELTAEEELIGVYSGVDITGALKLVVDGRERILHSGHIVGIKNVHQEPWLQDTPAELS